MTYTFHFYKERDRRWYFNDESKDIYHEEMVAGADIILNYYAKNNNFVDIVVTDRQPTPITDYIDIICNRSTPITDYIILDFIEEFGDGVIYCTRAPTFIEGWLCSTFWKYFERPAPLVLYFKVL